MAKHTDTIKDSKPDRVHNKNELIAPQEVESIVESRLLAELAERLNQTEIPIEMDRLENDPIIEHQRHMPDKDMPPSSIKKEIQSQPRL